MQRQRASDHYAPPDWTESRFDEVTRDQVRWILVSLVCGLLVVFLSGSWWTRMIGGLVFLPILLIGVYKNTNGSGFEIIDQHIDSRDFRRKTEGFGDTVPVDQADKRIGDLLFGRRIVGMYLGNESDRMDRGGHLPTGLLVSPDGGRVTCYFRIGGSNLASMSSADRKAAEQRVVDRLAEAAAMVGLEDAGLSIAPIFSVRPYNPQPMLHDLVVKDLHEDFIKAAEGSDEQRRKQQLQDRVLAMSIRARQPLYVYAITVNTPPEWVDVYSGASDEKIDADSVETSELKRLIDAITIGFGSTVFSDVTCMNVLELDEFIRTQFTLSRCGVLHDQMFNRRRRYGSMTSSEVVEDLAKHPPWPAYLARLTQTYSYLDGTYLAAFITLRFSHGREYAPGALGRLQAPREDWLTTTAVGRVLSAELVESSMTRSIVFWKALSILRKDTQRYQSEREMDDSMRRQRQQTEIYRGNAPVWRYNRKAVVLARSRLDLTISIARVLGEHARHGILMVPVLLEARQIAALEAVLLGVQDEK